MQPVASQPRIESAATAGDAGQLVGELLLDSGTQPTSPLQPSVALADAQLGQRLAKIALDHLRSELGSGNGPSLQGSVRIRRLAQAATAPPDLNGSGNNWDETLTAELQRLASTAGGAVPTGALPPLFTWHQASAQLRGALGDSATPDLASWRTLSLGDRTLRLLDVGTALRGRAFAAGRLLERARGTLAGASADEGFLGLVGVEQMLAVEETLLSTWFTDGGPLGAIADPRTYDPQNGARWLPAEVQAVVDPAAPDVVLDYRVLDSASDLAALASMLDTSAELVWLAGEAQTAPPTRAVFRGAPFEPPDPGPPPPHVLNWNDDVRALINFRCAGCHSGFPTGGWQMDTFALATTAPFAVRQRGFQMVVPGNHAQSFLWLTVNGPPSPFPRMPYFSSLMPIAERNRISEWIDAGALERQPTPPPPPAQGSDLARVLFYDLVALHLDANGGLHHRRESDGASGIATAFATGRALQTLARLAAAMPNLAYQSRTVSNVLASAATFARTRLLDGNGRALVSTVIAGAAASEPALLGDQAALTAGLLAASAALPSDVALATAAQQALAALLTFRDATTGLFGSDPTHRGARYTPTQLADLFAALRFGTLRDASVADVRTALLRRLAPLLANAEWDGAGEVLGDGIADTDGNGTPEPAAAGGAFGRLPLLAGAVLIGRDDERAANAKVTWSEHIRPLLFAKCAECHGNGTDQGHYRIDTLQLLDTPGDSGGALPLIVPGDPERSLLYRKLVDRLPPIGEQMPQRRTPLDDRGRELVRQWILDGATGR